MVTNDEFVQLRYDLLIKKDGGINTPAAPSICPRAPFDTLDYPYANRLGSLDSPEWRTLFRTKPEHIIAGNPYAQSTQRNGFACWDTAIAVPACDIRSDKITSLNQLSPTRNVNTFWTNEVTPSLRTVGAISGDGKISRPRIAGYSVDYKALDYYELIETAHVLAHIRGDEQKIGKKTHYAQSFTDRHMVQAIAEMTVALLFNLPINVSRYWKNNGEPNLPYGIKVTATTNYQEPMLIIPWKGDKAPAFDETVMIVHTAVHVEPYPYGFITGSNKYNINDRWCCMPALVTIVGIECIDYITHQNVVVVGHEPCYVTHYLDLLPPAYLANVISLGEQVYGKAQSSIEMTQVDTWVNSRYFDNAFMETPPLPCRECLLHNRAAEGKPIRPEVRPPKTLKKDNPWYKYEQDIKKLLRIIRNAVTLDLLRFFGSKCVRENLRERARRYKAKLRRLKDSLKLLKIYEKVRQGKSLSEKEQVLYLAHKK